MSKSDFLVGLAIGGAASAFIVDGAHDAAVSSSGKELAKFVVQNPSQGFYECKTSKGSWIQIPAADYNTGKITVSISDPVRPDTCKPHLRLQANANAAVPKTGG